MDFASALKRVLATGEVVLGSREAVKDVASGRAKLAVVAANCPPETAKQVKQYAELGGVPVTVFPGTSRQLGEACGKPFLVATLSVRNLGAVPLEELVNA